MKKKNMKKIIIMGTVKDVEEIIRGLVERYGGKTKLIDVIKKFNKDEVVLV